MMCKMTFFCLGTSGLSKPSIIVRTGDIARTESGDKLRGVSRNQICIGVATDKQNIVFFVEGTGKPTQKKTLELFRNHIKMGSTLIYDKESVHNKLVKAKVFLNHP